MSIEGAGPLESGMHGENEFVEVLSLTFSVAHSELVIPAGQAFELAAVDRVARSASVSAVRLHCWRV